MKVSLNNVIPFPLIEHQHFGDIWNKCLEFEQGKKYLINADSGKGKSTLLAFVYGLRTDFNGELLFDDLNTLELNLNDWAKLRQDSLSMMFQDLRLFDELTVEENLKVKFNLNNRLSWDDVLNLCSQIDVQQFLSKKVKFLSMGQQQRVALIRALIQPFNWLLLDEPFSHLDVKNRSIMEEIIVEQCQLQNAGLILTNLGHETGINFDHILSV